MIREGGAYVLMGSKPICTFPIEDGGFPETPDETQLAYELYLAEIKAGNLKEMPTSYDEFAKGCQNSVHLHHKMLWNLVNERLKEYVGPRYRFVVRKNPFGQRRRAGLFINIPNAILILKRYYQDFEKVYGASFDPENILDELGKEESIFWNRVFASNYLQGLILGYGRQNSSEFDWKMRNNIVTQRLERKGQEIEPLGKANITISDLPLPKFSIYSVDDRKLEKYSRERDLILEEFEGKDFEKVVKTWLANGL